MNKKFILFLFYSLLYLVNFSIKASKQEKEISTFSQQKATISIEDLPIETLQTIFSNIHVKDYTVEDEEALKVIYNLRLTSKNFEKHVRPILENFCFPILLSNGSLESLGRILTFPPFIKNLHLFFDKLPSIYSIFNNAPKQCFIRDGHKKKLTSILENYNIKMITINSKPILVKSIENLSILLLEGLRKNSFSRFLESNESILERWGLTPSICCFEVNLDKKKSSYFPRIIKKDKLILEEWLEHRKDFEYEHRALEDIFNIWNPLYKRSQ